MTKKIALAIILLLVIGLVAAGLFVLPEKTEAPAKQAEEAEGGVSGEVVEPDPEPEAEKPKLLPHVFVDNEVPFTAQAPFGSWSDPRQQDGCEEASVLMAVSWARGTELTQAEALEKILGAADYQQALYGSSVDTNVDDSVIRIANGYLNFFNMQTATGVTKEDIIQELLSNRLVLTPMDGQALRNPHFTAPGPERHMLVVRGYDPEAKEFITNDPGTRFGEAYRYDEDLFYAAIRDYPTGDHQPLGTTTTKSMITVSKK